MFGKKWTVQFYFEPPAPPGGGGGGGLIEPLHRVFDMLQHFEKILPSVESI